MFFYGIDPYFLIASLIGIVISMAASARVKLAFNKYAKVGVRSGMTGAEAAMAVARAGGAHDVTVERHQGFLSDHYESAHQDSATLAGRPRRTLDLLDRRSGS